MIYRATLPIAVAFAVLASAGPGVAGGIRCKDGYQDVAGSMLATPYCQDALLAAVAREYGMPVSAARIRANPNYKREVCRFVGHDIRVSHHCPDETPGLRGRGF